MAEFTMPSLGADMEEGTLLEWLVKPGDQVRKGDSIAVVDTAKAAVEVECFAGGTVDRILVQPGETVPVGTPLAVIATEPTTTGQRTAAEPSAAAPQPPPPAPTPALASAQSTPHRPGPAKRPITGPLVRKLAAELGIDLDTVHGTGRGGAITRADIQRATRPQPAGVSMRRRITPYARRLAAELSVDPATAAPGKDGVVHAADIRAAAAERAAAEPAAAERAAAEPAAAERAAADGAPVERAAPSRAKPSARQATARQAKARQATAREATARLMARSKREIPHYYLSTTIDLTRTMSRLREVNRDLPVERHVLPVAALLEACVVAATRVPALNGFWDDGFQPAARVHLGVAVALRGGGLVTPAILDAAGLSVVDLMDRLRDLVARARTGRLRGSELTSATLTVTNLGDRGVESVFGVIHPPQVALVGLGKVVERPWAVDGLLGVRPVVTATLSADHRATDGHTGALFLEALDHALNRPEEP
ncbi:dihydrolipoamide acetyltransferase family protein [Saccharothrix mutabilis subsp. mutabilis]|uniref:Dihydrolipoamide acetyltransferase component of pyruvate dehydrogenase complex n=1 Tax=Saccharothrix mutabilis subsp. mutabilis TaxID=66855 RepID=A0ABN0UGX3_9PSEU